MAKRRRKKRALGSFTGIELDSVTKKPILPGPPPGSYDPALDYQAGTASRGFRYTQEDAARDAERDAMDLTLARGDIATRFANMASSQAERAAASGVLSGGIAAQSRVKRNTLEARDRTDLEKTFARRAEDRQVGVSRGGVELDEFLRGIEASKVYSSGFTPQSGLGGGGKRRRGGKARRMAKSKGWKYIGGLGG